MTTSSSLLVRQPRDQLQKVLVERTWELATYLDDIEHAKLEEHNLQQTKSQTARHVWRAKANVPALLAPHISADHFAWTAFVEWSAEDFASRWRIEPHALMESLTCSAHVDLQAAMGGRATKIVFNVTIDGLDGRVGIETIAYRIVLVNWQKLVEAATRHLENSN